MDLFLFLFLIFIGYALWNIIKFAHRVNRVRKQSADMFAQMFGGMPGSQQAGEAAEGRRAGWTQAPRRAKRFAKGDGEYVSFDEVNGHTAGNGTASGNGTGAHTGPATRIEDAEWEDIR